MDYKEEIKEVLIREAKRRGLVKGAEIDNTNLKGGSTGYHKLQDNIYRFDEEDLTLYGWRIYQNGKWAKVVESTPKYTMTELIEMVGHKFDVKE